MTTTPTPIPPRWGGTRIRPAVIAEELKLDRVLVENVLASHDELVGIVVGQDHLVLVQVALPDGKMTFVGLVCDADDPRQRVIDDFFARRESAFQANDWDQRPRSDELFELLNSVSTDDFGWCSLDDLVDTMAEDAGCTSETAQSIIDCLWRMVYQGEHPEDHSFYLGRYWQSERDAEQALVENIGVLSSHGFNLEVWTSEEGRSGRQFVLPNGKRPDLICRDQTDGSVWILELKAFPCQVADIEQLEGYLDEFDRLTGLRARGLLLTNGTMVAARTRLGSHSSISQLNLETISLGAPGAEGQ